MDKIIAPIFFNKTEDSAECQHIITDFIANFLLKRGTIFCSKTRPSAHISGDYVLQEFFGDGLISRPLWSP